MWRDGSFHRQPGERLSWEQELSWSKTDHCRETDLSAASPVSASPENKNISWSKTDHPPRRIFPPPTSFVLLRFRVWVQARSSATCLNVTPQQFLSASVFASSRRTWRPEHRGSWFLCIGNQAPHRIPSLHKSNTHVDFSATQSKHL